MTEERGDPIIMLGAGHASLLALPVLRRAVPGVPVLLIDAGPRATYSGMVPGMVAGHYRAADLQVDLAAFAHRHGARFLQARVTGIDAAERRVRLTLPDGTTRGLGYDQAILDLGSHADMPDLAGFADHGVPVRPLSGLMARLPDPGSRRPVAVIGGGLAGCEMAMALAWRTGGAVTLIEASAIVAPALGPRARRRLHRAMDRAGIAVLTGARVARVAADAVILDDGRRIASAVTLGVAGARAWDWLARDLETDAAGFVRVGPTLQVPGHPRLFAVGDCAAMIHAPRPKAGVFAVRQAPILAHNLIAGHAGGPMRPFHPQRDHLKIVALGPRRALAEWRGLSVAGGWTWHLKDRIDRRHMARLQDGPCDGAG